MALPEDILQDLEIRQSLQNRFPFPAIGGGGLNLTGYTPQYSSMVGPIATGQAYAQQIAGGIPFEQVVAPGMSFSPEQPMGYTQADLNVVNLPTDVAPVFPELPTTGEVFEPSYPTMPYAPTGTPMPQRIPSIFGIPAPQLPQIDLSQIQLPQFDLSQIKLPEIDVSQFVTKEELPSFVPSFEMPQIPEIDVSRFIEREEIPRLLADLPQAQIPDVSQFVTQQDISEAIAGIPQVSLSDIEERLAALELAPVPTLPSYNLPKPLGFFS
jgi:hypothetical protein